MEAVDIPPLKIMLPQGGPIAPYPKHRSSWHDKSRALCFFDMWISAIHFTWVKGNDILFLNPIIHINKILFG